MRIKDRLALIEEMLDSNPKDSFLNYAAALEYKKVGEFTKAIGLLKHIISYDPEYLGAYYQLGKLLEDQNNYTEAIDFYKLGKTQAEQQNDSKALGELSEALMLLDADDDDVF